MNTPPVLKRRRDTLDDQFEDAERFDKKARPTTGNSEDLWQPASLLTSPSRSYHSDHAKYDSDDQSSMVSEPGSPQALSDDAMDEDEDADMADSDSLSPLTSKSAVPGPLTPWKNRARGSNRIATPIVPLNRRPNPQPLQTHIRRRHPQENISSPPSNRDRGQENIGNRLEVPSPIDEDEVPTPPSAAEAAGSQLELLSVSDVEMSNPDLPPSAQPLPRIAVQPERSPQRGRGWEGSSDMPAGPALVVPKQRQRSGALSAGGEGSPMRDASGDGMVGVVGGKRGISMGFRGDCEKCRMRVPGHMNHFF